MDPEPSDQHRSQELRPLEGEMQSRWHPRLLGTKLLRPHHQGVARRDAQIADVQPLPAKLSLAQRSFR